MGILAVVTGINESDVKVPLVFIKKKNENYPVTKVMIEYLNGKTDCLKKAGGYDQSNTMFQIGDLVLYDPNTSMFIKTSIDIVDSEAVQLLIAYYEAEINNLENKKINNIKDLLNVVNINYEEIKKINVTNKVIDNEINRLSLLIDSLKNKISLLKVKNKQKILR